MTEIERWVTIRGVHIPIIKGENKSATIQRFLKSKQSDRTRKLIDTKTSEKLAFASSTYKKQLKTAEDKIRNKSTEYVAIIDKDGNILLEKGEGKTDEVIFTSEESAKLKNSTLTHNHPLGGGFSKEDLDAAYSRGVHEIRACHTNGCYILTRNFDISTKIPKKYSKFAEDYRNAENIYMRDIVDDIFKRTNDAVRCNNMVNDYGRTWLKKNAKKYGWTYKEE